MTLEEGIRNRRSVRKYIDKKVPNEVIEKIVELARFSPSWKNTQISRVFAISDLEVRSKIANDCTYGFASNTNMILNASHLMVLAYIKGRSGYERDGSFTTSKEDRWESFDAGIFAQTFALACTNFDVKGCILGIFDEEKVKEVLGLGSEYGIGCLIPIGYSDEIINAPKRKEVEEILKFI